MSEPTPHPGRPVDRVQSSAEPHKSNVRLEVFLPEKWAFTGGCKPIFFFVVEHLASDVWVTLTKTEVFEISLLLIYGVSLFPSLIGQFGRVILFKYYFIHTRDILSFCEAIFN